MVGLRSGVLFGHTSCLKGDVLKMVSGWLQAGAQQSAALDQAISVLTGAAGQSPLQDEPPKTEEEKKDDQQADASPEMGGGAGSSASPTGQEASPQQVVGGSPSGQERQEQAAVTPGNGV